VGEDSWFLTEALDLGFPLERTAPFTTGKGSTEKFLVSGEPRDLTRRIRKAYRALAAETELVVVEGTGHPGVGSVFGLSNADVAAALDIPVILVLDGGVGSTIDRFTLCSSIFDQAGIRVAGVVINRVHPARMDKVRKLLGGWFNDAGVRILGFVPWLQSISRPSLGTLSRILEAEYIGSAESRMHPVSGFITAFANRNETLREVSEDPYSAVVLSAGRTDIIDALVARRVAGGEKAGPGALILCGEGETDSSLVGACEQLSLPLYRTISSAGKANSILSGRIFKAEPGEFGKIEETVKLIESAVDMEAVMDILEHPAEAGPEKPRRLLTRILEKPAGLIRKVLGKSGSRS
jgi:BioD-like phosphotransacetylase family protein